MQSLQKALAAVALSLIASGCGGEGKATTGEDAILCGEFAPIASVADLPLEVRALLDRRFEDASPLRLGGIADAGSPFNATDLIETGLPMRRLVIAGESRDSLFIFYEHGGMAYHRHLIVFGRPGGVYKPHFATILTGLVTGLDVPFADVHRPFPAVLEALQQHLRAHPVPNELRGVHASDAI